MSSKNSNNLLKVQRSKNGCFTCRQKKKKCDEKKPRCLRCSTGSLECVWPHAGNMSLPHHSKFVPKKETGNRRFSFVVSFADGSSLKKLIDNKKPTVEPLESSQSVLKVLSNRDSNNIVIQSFDNRTGINEPVDNFRSSTLDIPKEEKGDSIDKNILPSLKNFPSSISDGFFTSDRDSHEERLKSRVEEKLVLETNYRNRLDLVNSKRCGNEFFFSNSAIINGSSTWITGIQLSTEDAYLYHAFINGFIAAISPQLTHPKLTPGAIFVPPGVSSPVLRHIFFACGAAHLSWRRPELKSFAQYKYAACLNELANLINAPETEGTEDWMLIATLLLCLRDKHFGTVPSKPAGHLTMAFQIIRKRQNEKVRNRSQLEWDIMFEKSFLKSPPKSKSLKDNLSIATPIHSIEEVNCYSEKDLICLEQKEFKDSDNLVLAGALDNDNKFKNYLNRLCMMPSKGGETKLEFSPTEKTLIESFLYNYSVNLLISKPSQIGFLPSPFQIFDQFRDMLYDPIYDCPVSWMNNPVFGAALESYEFAAKASWLCFKLPLDHENMKLAQKLFKDLMFYVPPVLPTNISSSYSKEVYHKLTESVLVADIVAKAAHILVAKLVNPNLLQNDEMIQRNVTGIYNGIRRLPPNSLVYIICGWPLVVAGAAAIFPVHKEYIRMRCLALSELIHGEHMTQIVNFLQKAWGNDLNSENAPGWNLLFDRDALEKMCL
ncbi:hypothetical protein PACTADRAFT_1111 [Pachysolen tannophilus NRRL Y-2460]|uniref:Zn(2)-C6 fungal-type domain-containing protein n=1 Tax=Pachysolen tannophilus NRRL Y-2460 TaxID=669874 RepID=A0A1E4TXQ4_PACTA|nr:hypothetical protein PACTADRAFT_1111 [Pachysolen tannophilus NRRL Y-2460]